MAENPKSESFIRNPELKNLALGLPARYFMSAARKWPGIAAEYDNNTDQELS